MVLDENKVKLVKLIDEKHMSFSEAAKMLNLDKTLVHGYYGSIRRFVYAYEREKDNKDHIIHLNITPLLYGYLGRAHINSIEKLKDMIEDNSIYKVRGFANKSINDLRFAIVEYENKVDIDILDNILVNRDLRYIKFNVSLVGLHATGIYEFNINTKEKSLYMKSCSEQPIEIQNIIIKSIHSKVDKDHLHYLALEECMKMI